MFRQEGWRLEPEDLAKPDSQIIFKGVVYNEMKGVFVRPLLCCLSSKPYVRGDVLYSQMQRICLKLSCSVASCLVIRTQRLMVATLLTSQI